MLLVLCYVPVRGVESVKLEKNDLTNLCPFKIIILLIFTNFDKRIISKSSLEDVNY